MLVILFSILFSIKQISRINLYLSTGFKIWNTRILQLMKEAVGSDVAATKKEWCELIGIRQSNLIEVESGKRGFTIEQIVRAAEVTGVPTDWILGLSKTRKGANEATGLDLIKEGVRLLEEQKRKKTK